MTLLIAVWLCMGAAADDRRSPHGSANCAACHGTTEPGTAAEDMEFATGHPDGACKTCHGLEHEEWSALAARLQVDDPDTLVSQPQVKSALRENTEEAARRGVFGVPTFAVGDELFWGADLTDMLLDYIADPKLFTRGEMARVDSLPIGAERR